MRGQTYIILAFIFALIVAVFAVINVDPVEVNYLIGTGNAPLILVILVSVLMGAIIVAAVGMVRLFRLQREIHTLRQQNRKLRSEKEGQLEETPVVDEKPNNVQEDNTRK